MGVVVTAERIWHLTGAAVTVNNFRVLEMLKLGQQSLFLLFQISRKSIIQASFNTCFLSFGDSHSHCWSWSPRGLAVHSLRWRTQSLDQGVGFILQERFHYMEGNHYLLFYATEKVWALLGWARRDTAAVWPFFYILCEYDAFLLWLSKASGIYFLESMPLKLLII